MLVWEVESCKPVDSRPRQPVDRLLRVAVIANHHPAVVDRPAIGGNEAGIVEDIGAGVVAQEPA